MSKRILKIMALIALSTISACQQQGTSRFSELEITFVNEKVLPDYSPVTRAVQVTDLESFNVTAIKAGTVLWEETATFEDGIYTTGRFWSESDEGESYYASNGTVYSDESVPYLLYDRSSDDLDLLAAVNASPTYRGNNPLAFSHLLTRIGTLSVQTVNGYSATGLSAVLESPLTSGKWSFDGTWSDLAEGADESLSQGANNIWLIPGTYTLTVSYTLSASGYSVSCTGSAEVTLSAGQINMITVTAGEHAGISVSASVLPWDYREDSYSYSTEITIGNEGRLTWQSGTYTSLSSETHRVISAFNTDFQADFLIESPEGSTWYAILETQSGALDAFRFVDDGGNLSASAHGVVGEEGHIRIRQTNLYPSVTNSATLLFVVRSGGRNIPVTGLVDNLGSNWTIIQNANN